jgi:hypothetical protein
MMMKSRPIRLTYTDDKEDWRHLVAEARRLGGQINVLERELDTLVAERDTLRTERDLLAAIATEAEHIMQPDWDSHSLLILAFDALDAWQRSQEGGDDA